MSDTSLSKLLQNMQQTKKMVSKGFLAEKKSKRASVGVCVGRKSHTRATMLLTCPRPQKNCTIAASDTGWDGWNEMVLNSDLSIAVNGTGRLTIVSMDRYQCSLADVSIMPLAHTKYTDTRDTNASSSFITRDHRETEYFRQLL